MSHLKRAALTVATAVLLAAPSASAATPIAATQSSAATTQSSAATTQATVATTPVAAATPTFQRVTIGATTGVVYLTRSETRQVGQGGAWVIAGAVGLALAPQTAGVGTFAAIAVGFALGSIGSKLIDAQLAKNLCIKISVPWLSLGTTAKIGWTTCLA